MAVKSRLTTAAEIAQILTVPLALLGIVVAVLALLVSMNKWPDWIGVPRLSTLAALFAITLALIGLLVCLGLYSGLARLRRLEGAWENEQSERAKAVELWQADRNREMAQRCISEYAVLERKVDDFVATANAVVEREVRARVIDKPTRAKLDRLIVRGDELFAEIRLIPRGNDAVARTLCDERQKNLMEWEQEAQSLVDQIRPGFGDELKAHFEPPPEADTRTTLIARAVARLERLRMIKAAVI